MKMAKTDSDKRQEIFLELVYWVFDSFLIPLIRSNFYVTESNVHKNQLFYFRHDVWRMLTEPSLLTLRANMFEDMPADHAIKLLAHRQIGFSRIRLLPKSTGVRLITNLKRRQQVMRNGTMILGRSINSVMAPVFNIMNYEKVSLLCITWSVFKLTLYSHSSKTSSVPLCSQLVKCTPNWRPLSSLCRSRDSQHARYTLPKSMCCPVSIPYPSNVW